MFGSMAGPGSFDREALLAIASGNSPRAFDALMQLATNSRAKGDIQEAIAFAARAVPLRPSDARLHDLLGSYYFAARDWPRAIESFTKATAMGPNVAAHWRHLAHAERARGNERGAADAFFRALSLAPTSVEILQEFSQTLLNVGDFPGAEEAARAAVGLDPRSALSHLLLSGALLDQGKVAEGEEHLERGIALDPERRHALTIGVRQQSLGRMESANANFRRAIESDPNRPYGYFRLINNSRVTEEDRPLVERLRQISLEQGRPIQDSIAIHFSLGKALEDLGDYEASMASYDTANSLCYQSKLGGRSPDCDSARADVDRTVSIFGPDTIDRAREVGGASEVPICIVGMMRSGTTLVEQIVSSHPDVAPAGEQLFWMENFRSAFSPDRSRILFDRLPGLAEGYLELLRERGADAPRITDKLPENYHALGLIHLAFPNALIIHVRRHPVDTCISIYATPNRTVQEFGYVREHIVFAYREYLRLMEHWRSVLPSDRFLEVDYEAIVEDREHLTREMIEFLGLAWDDACLRPDENRRSVATPSSWQVRQPVYSSSIGRWKRFEPWLGAFRELMPPGTGLASA